MCRCYQVKIFTMIYYNCMIVWLISFISALSDGALISFISALSDGALGLHLPWGPRQMSYLPILKAGPGQDVIWPLHHQCYIPSKLSAIWYAKTPSKVTYYKAMCYDLGFYFTTSTHCLPYHITHYIHVQQLTSIYFLHCTYSCTKCVYSHWCCVTR